MNITNEQALVDNWNYAIAHGLFKNGKSKDELKKECEKLQSEVEYLRRRNEELAKEFEEYKRRIDSIRNTN